MDIATTRFGTISIHENDVLLFEQGLIGYENRRRWVLLADTLNDAIGWLQCVDNVDLALAVVSPRRFVPSYRIRISRSELDPLQLDQVHQAYVLTIVGKQGDQLTLNLKAPVIINLDRRLARQVITSDEQPLQMELASVPVTFRKSA